MEFIKKNWIWILVAIIVIVAVIIYFRRKSGSNKLLGRIGIGNSGVGVAHIPGQVGNESAIIDVKTIIKLGVTSLEDLKQKALAKGYHVMSKQEAALARMTPDPKRVIVDVMQINCIKAPCPQAYNVISVG